MLFYLYDINVVSDGLRSLGSSAGRGLMSRGEPTARSREVMRGKSEKKRGTVYNYPVW